MEAVAENNLHTRTYK